MSAGRAVDAWTSALASAGDPATVVAAPSVCPAESRVGDIGGAGAAVNPAALKSALESIEAVVRHGTLNDDLVRGLRNNLREVLSGRGLTTDKVALASALHGHSQAPEWARQVLGYWHQLVALYVAGQSRDYKVALNDLWRVLAAARPPTPAKAGAK